MIDSGATNSFIDQIFLASTRISTIPKDTPIELQVIDGRSISSGAITHHTSPVKLSISGHEETISLDITSLGSYAVILGLPWLSQHNPNIDWAKPSIVFSSQHCFEQCIWPDQPKGRDSASPVPPDLVGRHASSNSSNQVEQSRSLTSSNSEPQSMKALGTLLSSEAPLKISLVSAAAFRSALKTATVYGITNSQFSDSVYHPSPAQWDDDSDPDTSTLRSSVPVEFHDFLDVFRKSNSDKLPDHGKYDHSIPLEGTTQPPFGPIF
ncbi:hypothetical protein P7C73_g6616, partial [Tremellales sp. Uapishka_1]